jgi:uncharacterized protein
MQNLKNSLSILFIFIPFAFFAQEEELEEFDTTLNGVYQSFYEDGSLKTEESYLKGKKQGVYKQFFPNGRLLYEMDYVNNELDGQWIEFYTNGDTSEISQFSEGFLEGVSVTFFPDQALKSIGKFHAGEKAEKWLYYNEYEELTLQESYDSTGELMLTEEFVDSRLYEEIGWKGGLFHGEYTLFFPNGEINEFQVYANGKANGSYYEGDSIGNPLIKGRYKYDVKDGLWEYFLSDAKNSSKTVLHQKELYENGKLIYAEDLFKNEKQIQHGDGNRVFYDQKGAKTLEIAFKKGFENGQLTEYQKDKISYTVNFIDGKRTGVAKEFHPNAALKSQVIFENDLENGLFYELNLAGDTIILGFYKEGLKDSLWLYADENGELIQEGYYARGMKVGEWLDYHSNGKTAIERYYFNDLLDGEYFEFYPEGEVKVHGRFDDGEPVDYWFSYDEKGNIKEKGEFWKGEREGKWIEFYTNKIPQSESYFVGGFQHGICYEYDKNGKLTSEGFYYYDLEDSVWTTYYQNGQIHSVERYQLGRLSNVLSMYDTKGDKIDFGKFKNGDGELIRYHSNSKIASKGNFTDGMPNGKWKFYHENGLLKAEGELKFGDKIGEWTYYSSKKGKIEAKGNYEYGEPVGEWQFYDEKGKLKQKVDLDKTGYGFDF